ncbi:MAG TPA: hypothetical protein DEA08_04870 [Planctomycetes bacterium]|nr:hypothetical protein [Planctomycetota bacterium]
MADYTSRFQQAELAAVLESRRSLEGDFVGHIDLAELELYGFRANQSTLRDTCLVKVHFPESRWTEVAFQGAELRQARLEGSLIEGCAFDQARLMQLDLSGGIVSRSKLEQTNLSRIKLAGARLTHLVFDDCDLTAADLSGAHLVHCEFKAPRQLGGANLARVDLRGARFIDCNLEGVNLREAKLEGATFISCDLRGANAYEADLAGASLIGCNCEGINLEQSNCKDLSHAGTRFFHATTGGASF